jgi:hypothetical protein
MKENLQKIIKIIFIIVGLAVLISFIIFFLNKEKVVFSNTMKVAFPYIANIGSNTSFACEALLSSDIIGSPEEYLTNGIEGTIKKGTDNIAMSIKDPENLTFITGASVGVGVTEGETFSILKNDNEKLVAFWSNDNVVSTVVLNKNNGLGIWSKGNSDFLLYDAPYGSIVYMICR